MDQKTRQHITNIQEEIKNVFKTSCDKIKFVEKDNLHLSLKFLGELTLLEIEKTFLALQKTCFQQQLFEVTLSRKIGIFPDYKNPRVIWLGIENGCDKIEKIYHSIQKELNQEPFYSVNKNFTPHITACRVKYLNNPKKLIDFLNYSQSKNNNVSQKINAIELMESQLTPRGPIYRVLNHFPLMC